MQESGIPAMREGIGAHQFRAGLARHQADVLVRAGAGAVEAQHAVHVALDLRDEQ